MTDLVDLAHTEHGPADAPAVVLIHGLGSMGVWWPPPLVAALAEEHRVVVVDLRDSGRSPALDHLGSAAAAFAAWAAGSRPTPPYTLAHVAGDVVGLFDDLAIDRGHVVGASMGGMVAQHIAFGHPARTASLTSIMSTTGAPDLPPGHPEVLAALQESSPTHDEDAYVAASLAAARRNAHSPLFDAAEAERRYRAYWAIGPNPAGSARHLAAVVHDGDRTDRLREITAPTLVVHGANDPLLRVEGGRATAAAIERARYLELSDVGHELPRQVHRQVAAAIADLVSAAERQVTS